MNSLNKIVSVVDVSRIYAMGSEQITAISGISLDVYAGSFVAIVGRSGSGKTTLLNLMAGLDKSTTGRVFFLGRDIADMSENELIELRRHKIGFVFQSFGLLPLLSAFENVELPLRISGIDSNERHNRTTEALDVVGLASRSRHRPYELSGGEQQRVAIARAMVSRPAVIMADEPTGELDSSNAKVIFSLFAEMVRTEGISVVVATHDSTLLALADEVIEMRDGQIVSLKPGHA